MWFEVGVNVVSINVELLTQEAQGMAAWPMNTVLIGGSEEESWSWGGNGRGPPPYMQGRGSVGSTA